MRVFSEFESPVASMVSENITIQYDATVQHDERHFASAAAAADATVLKLCALPWSVVAVLPGAETGVELSNRLQCVWACAITVRV